jgi:16S rRNA G966 N2-methylase RsmD
MTSEEFIKENQHTPPAEIALLLSKKPELDSEFIISQVNGLQKAKNKLPEFYQNKKITYPVPLSIEQCSSETTAIYKSKLIKGKSLVDLTGGFGIDSYYFSKQFKTITYIEPNEQLFKIVNQNFKALNGTNITSVNTTSEEFLENSNQKFDLAYIDPSRRDETKRVYLLNDCTPNIIELAEDIFKVANQILVKAAPLLDITQSIKELKYVSKIFVVALNNDCKEVLYLLNQNKTVTPPINTVNLSSGNQFFEFDFEDEQAARSSYSLPQKYLYEPNAAILKAGAFNSIAQQFGINKIAPNSHLYTSEEHLKDFPGRSFKVEKVVNYNPKEFKKLEITKANIACRNFKVKPEEVKKKLKLKDGGSTYLFATTDNNNKPILVICVK